MSSCLQSRLRKYKTRVGVEAYKSIRLWADRIHRKNVNRTLLLASK